MSAQKLEVLDFIIWVLCEHERELDSKLSRLETMLRYYEPLTKEVKG